MRRGVQLTRELIGRALAAADAAMNRLYGWRGNPLYQSGTIVVLAFLVMLITGIYLLFFYRVGDPYASMLRIEGQVWSGRWIRALHRYAADLTILAAAIHALRMFAQGRSFGPRTLAWASGLVLLFGMFVCGWTGYVMVWDEQGLLLAAEGARLLDALPVFSEPLARTFVGERPLPGAFFFLNLFAHVALPIGIALLLWVHVSRLARPILLPPRGLSLAVLALLFAASVLAPAPLGLQANPFSLPAEVRLDWLYSFWVPWTRGLRPEIAWLGVLAFAVALLLAPLWTRTAPAHRPPSSTDPHLCTGCFQCALDCPYGAIDMIDIPEREHPVARVDPDLCVSCGICAGSCAPMAVGPPTRTGRDEVADVRAFLTRRAPRAGDVVVIACQHGAGRVHRDEQIGETPVYPARCAGNLHTSVIELLLRAGFDGVMVATCPPRDCQGREGPRWLEARVHEGREAELRESLDRRRLRIVYAAEAERGVVVRELESFQRAVRAVASVAPETDPQLETECDTTASEVAS
jgi:quinol-cytochrome oxidoreductase complex cytochrome b subunit/coenzyme F420-reducing hydrogenase delta subunit